MLKSAIIFRNQATNISWQPGYTPPHLTSRVDTTSHPRPSKMPTMCWRLAHGKSGEMATCKSMRETPGEMGGTNMENIRIRSNNLSWLGGYNELVHGGYKPTSFLTVGAPPCMVNERNHWSQQAKLEWNSMQIHENQRLLKWVERYGKQNSTDWLDGHDKTSNLEYELTMQHRLFEAQPSIETRYQYLDVLTETENIHWL